MFDIYATIKSKISPYGRNDNLIRGSLVYRLDDIKNLNVKV